MPWPAVIVLEESATDAMTYRYSAAREFGGDSWHETVAAAKHSAAAEYGDLLSGWLAVPEGEDPFEFAMRSAPAAD